MFLSAVSRLVTQTARVHLYADCTPVIRRLTPSAVSVRSLSDLKDGAQQPFDTSLLQVLVCPLSKKPLRYDADTNELINEDLGIAYPIIDGIPNMIPQEARMVHKESGTSTDPAQD
ncbi:protein preY, mitochondrial [Notolabrus celidotus]|uniref:protein preY, mitochondrial n=1 Tax=Notolabrus celidotus TaxID=1203425 RepID=UPI00148FAFAC|nr:protein preY, mitochondrial [Notolabrus celidotus]